jgi:predicted RecA/RadA family phage recombinase
MAQFFRRIIRNILEKKDAKDISLNEDRIKIGGKVNIVSDLNVNLDNLGVGGLDANYGENFRTYNIFAVSSDQGPSLVASLNLNPQGFDNSSFLGRALVNPENNEIISVKYDYLRDKSIEKVLDLSATSDVVPDNSVKKVSLFNWDLVNRGVSTNLSWQSITYGNNLFVAVSNSGVGNRVMTSPDGVIWTSRTSASDNNWSSVTFGNNLFVAVSTSGTGNRVMTSSDGITWTSRTSAADVDWRSVTFGKGRFVAVSSSGSINRIMYSNNGVSWSIGNVVSKLNTQRVVNDSDGPLNITSGQIVVVPEGSVKNYSSINIASGGILEISGNSGGWTEIGCSGNCVINGQIIARAGNAGQPTHDSNTFSKLSSFGLGFLTYSITQRLGGSGTPAPNWTYSYSKNVPAPPAGTGRKKNWYYRTAPGGAGGGQFTGGGGAGGGLGGRINSGDSATMPGGGAGGLRGTSTLTGAVGAGTSGGAGGGGGLFSAGANGARNGGSGWTGGGGGAGTTEAGTGGGGGGYKGNHGKGLVLYIEGTISGTGTVLSSGTSGFNGGSGSLMASSGGNVLSGRGGGGAGGSGGSVVVRYNGGSLPNINVSGGSGGIGGSTGSSSAQNGQAGNAGSVTLINASENSFQNNWWSVSFGGDFFVAFASAGVGTRAMYSSDGITWELLSVNYLNSWRSVCFGDGLFVAVSDDGTPAGNQIIKSLRF